MNKKPMLQWRAFFLIATIAFVLAACEKKKPPVEELPLPADRVNRSPVGTTQSVLHKTFAVTSSAAFPFEIPAHAAIPHLHGSYRSFVDRLGIQTNDDSTNVDFLILNEDQHADFVHGRAVEALFSTPASHNQDVDVGLPASNDQPQKYYLVFRNTPGGEAKKVVQADFTLDF
jgi:hypothetical protein